MDPARIGCIGHSLGGHNALFPAAFDTRVSVVVTSCGFMSFRKYLGGNLANWSQPVYMPRIADAYGNDGARMPFDFQDVLAAIAPRAVFVNAPLKDTNFDVSGVRQCLAAVAPVYEFLGAKGQCAAVHPDAAHSFPPECRETAYAFIDAVLRRPALVPAGVER